MLRSLLSLLSLLVLVVFLVPACGDPDGTLDDDDTADDDDDITPPDDDDDDDATADDDDATSAPATVVDVHPDDGTTDHYVHEAVWVDFSAAAEDAEISLADADGGAVDGDPIWLSETRLALNFDGLSFSTHYTATVTWAGGAETHSWEFDTSTVGETATEADLVGNTYAYDPRYNAFVDA